VRDLAIYKYILADDIIANLRKDINNMINDLSSCCKAFNESTLFELKVVLNELILNAVYHGNKCDITKKVKVTTGISDNTNIFIVIEDEGCGYDLSEWRKNFSTQDNLVCIDEMKENGRGLDIVEKLCDIIRFNEKGNKVVVYKKL